MCGPGTVLLESKFLSGACLGHDGTVADVATAHCNQWESKLGLRGTVGSGFEVVFLHDDVEYVVMPGDGSLFSGNGLDVLRRADIAAAGSA